MQYFFAMTELSKLKTFIHAQIHLMYLKISSLLQTYSSCAKAFYDIVHRSSSMMLKNRILTLYSFPNHSNSHRYLENLSILDQYLHHTNLSNYLETMLLHLNLPSHQRLLLKFDCLQVASLC